MRRRHAMPFGATVQPAGGVLFRLWAPAARRVDLCLEGLAELPMQGREAGWFELFVADAAAGSRYRYRIDGGLRVPDPTLDRAHEVHPLDLVRAPRRVGASSRVVELIDREPRGQTAQHGELLRGHTRLELRINRPGAR
ncbi:MAG: hypothetical protein CVU16_15105 [Betaproteobacteria bacterium HGW-Betaproteobacteria-10]|nr:MAG: hypothetical protein CVU16_15105 [Betaproteobacteria bacterium HGW-Betaproteobacteria-10]